MQSVITRNNTIRVGHPIREEVASLSTGVYYPQFVDWIEKIERILQKYRLSAYNSLDFPLHEGLDTPHTRDGHTLMPIYQTDGGTHPPTVGNLWYSWHRMESGNWEIICYLA